MKGFSSTVGEDGYTLFDTAVGRCGIAWCGDGVVAVQLPEESDDATRDRLTDGLVGAFESAPPPAVASAIVAIVSLLAGEDADLSAIPLDMSGVPPFHRRVYEAIRAIPAGEVLSYGQVADLVNAPGAARAVGRALGRNPFPIVVPCHRVLASGGRIGGFSAHGGIDTKLRLLAIERRQVAGE